MTLLVEQSKNGKPLILYNNYKYRESHCLKNGERAWRCLGGKCGATVRTNADATQIVSSSGKHQGPHPVTMRTLSLSPLPSRRASSPATTACAPTPVASLAQSAVTPAPSSNAKSPASAACVPTRVVLMTPTAVSPATSAVASTPDFSDTTQSASATEVADLVAENNDLKDRLLQLDEQFKNVLDHSIQSDTRLMQYTDQVFVANTPRIGQPTRASVADCGVQCDLPINCRDQLCAETKDLVASLKVTIEVLEAELECLRELRNCECAREQPSEWSVVHYNKKHIPTKTDIRQQALSGSQQTCRPKPSVIPSSPSGKQKKKKKTVKQNIRREPRTSLPFSSILIEGDSHSRGIAGLVQRKVTRDTKVEGVCKPGAKLLDATSEGSPPPGSCCIIIAGTNDVASGRQCNIYRHLEQRIKSKLRTAVVVVSTLPHRHDLPASHQINQETAVVNGYIEELCVRHRGAVVLNFNHIGRGAFTPHGMHLRPNNKHLLADLLVECLRGMNHSFHVSPSQPPTTAAESPSTRSLESPSAPPLSILELPVAAQPRVLPFDSFAEAVKSGSSVPQAGQSTSTPATNHQKNFPFSNYVNLT